MSKDLSRRLVKLEKERAGSLQRIFLVVRFEDKGHAQDEPKAYGREFNGPRVMQRPGEPHKDFYERAKAELLGDSAQKPGVHVLFGWNE